MFLFLKEYLRKSEVLKLKLFKFHRRLIIDVVSRFKKLKERQNFKDVLKLVDLSVKILRRKYDRIIPKGPTQKTRNQIFHQQMNGNSKIPVSLRSFIYF